MKKSNLLLIVAMASISLQSCIKADEQIQPASTDTEFKSLTVADDFNWNTANAVTLQITGTQTTETVTNTLIISSEDMSATYYTGQLAMDANANIKFALPIDQNSVLVRYGSIQKVVAISNKTGNFNYLPSLPDVE